MVKELKSQPSKKTHSILDEADLLLIKIRNIVTEVLING